MRTNQVVRAVTTIAAVAALTLSLAACTSSTKDTGTTAEPTAGATVAVPAFEGPYADEFAREYASATSDFEREVLKDGQITDAEYAEMSNRFSSCLADQGLTFSGFNADGSFSTSGGANGSDNFDVIDECGESSGENSIGMLHDIMGVNPDNEDGAKLQAECLVRKGVVPADYSAEEYTQDAVGRFADYGSLSPELQEALVSCSSDPLDGSE